MKKFSETHFTSHIDHKEPEKHAKAIKAFEELGGAQRGKPESAMLRVQEKVGGGVMNPVVEHVGDLTHRMSHMAKYGNFLHGIVADKVRKTHNWLTSGYGFEREHNQNIKNNAEYRGVPAHELHKEVDDRLKSYAHEHSKLPVYNEAQYHAREAAVAVGHKHFHKAIGHLEKLKDMTKDGETWQKHASTYHHDVHGNLVQYKP